MFLHVIDSCVGCVFWYVKGSWMSCGRHLCVRRVGCHRRIQDYCQYDEGMVNYRCISCSHIHTATFQYCLIDRKFRC